MAEQPQSVSTSGNTVQPLTEEELKALTNELQAVLEKHNAEMGVTSTINLMKVVKTSDESETTTEDEPVEEAEEAETNSEAESSS